MSSIQLNKVIQILLADPEVLRRILQLARQLGIDESSNRQLNIRVSQAVFSYEDILHDILTPWISKSENESTLQQLIHILNQLQFNNCAEKLKNEIKNKVSTTKIESELGRGSHEKWAVNLANAQSYLDEKNFLKALETYEMVYKEQECSLGISHSHTKETANKINNLKYCPLIAYLGDHKVKASYLSSLICVQSSLLGAEHSQTLNSTALLANHYAHFVKEGEKAIELFGSAFGSQARLFGLGDHRTEETRMMIKGLSHCLTFPNDKAHAEHLEKVYSLLVSVLGKSHDDSIEVLSWIANYTREHNPFKSLNIYGEIYQLQNILYGYEDTRCAQTRENMDALWAQHSSIEGAKDLDQKQLHEAYLKQLITFLEVKYKLMQNLFGETHVKTIKTKLNLVDKLIDEDSEASKLKAIDIIKQIDIKNQVEDNQLFQYQDNVRTNKEDWLKLMNKLKLQIL